MDANDRFSPTCIYEIMSMRSLKQDDTVGCFNVYIVQSSRMYIHCIYTAKLIQNQRQKFPTKLLLSSVYNIMKDSICLSLGWFNSIKDFQYKCNKIKNFCSIWTDEAVISMLKTMVQLENSR